MSRSVTSAMELGYDCLKSKQLEVMSEFVWGKDDVFVCLPTGSGMYVSSTNEEAKLSVLSESSNLFLVLRRLLLTDSRGRL